jgi:hypothetical protein|nr:MAG TPA: hypothetical protein [Caudoviricetes sp.]
MSEVSINRLREVTETIMENISNAIKKVKDFLLKLSKELKIFLIVALDLDFEAKGKMSFKRRYELWREWRSRQSRIKKLLILFGVLKDRSFERHLLLKRAYSDIEVDIGTFKFYENYITLEKKRYLDEAVR